MKLAELMAQVGPPSSARRQASRARSPEVEAVRAKLLQDWKGDARPFRAWVVGRPHGHYQRDIDAAVESLIVEGWTFRKMADPRSLSRDVQEWEVVAPAEVVAAETQKQVTKYARVSRLPLHAESLARPTAEDLRFVNRWAPVAGEAWGFYDVDPKKGVDPQVAAYIRKNLVRGALADVERAVRLPDPPPKGLVRARPPGWFDAVLGVKAWHPVRVSEPVLGSGKPVSPYTVLEPFLAPRDNRYGIDYYLWQRAIEFGMGPGRRRPEHVAELPGEIAVTDGNQLSAVYVREVPPDDRPLAIWRDFAGHRPLLVGKAEGGRGAYNLCGREVRFAGEVVDTRQAIPSYADHFLRLDEGTMRAFVATRPSRGRAFQPPFYLIGGASEVRWGGAGEPWTSLPLRKLDPYSGEVVDDVGWDGPRVATNAEMVYALFKSFLRWGGKGWTVVVGIGKTSLSPILFWQQDARGVPRRYHVLMPIRVD